MRRFACTAADVQQEKAGKGEFAFKQPFSAWAKEKTPACASEKRAKTTRGHLGKIGENDFRKEIEFRKKGQKRNKIGG